ncbi:hypothetical protein ABIB07_001856 [Bradyrhizobium sp. RT10b]
MAKHFINGIGPLLLLLGMAPAQAADMSEIKRLQPQDDMPDIVFTDCRKNPLGRLFCRTATYQIWCNKPQPLPNPPPNPFPGPGNGNPLEPESNASTLTYQTKLAYKLVPGTAKARILRSYESSNVEILRISDSQLACRWSCNATWTHPAGATGYCEVEMVSIFHKPGPTPQ